MGFGWVLGAAVMRGGSVEYSALFHNRSYVNLLT